MEVVIKNKVEEEEEEKNGVGYICHDYISWSKEGIS